MRIAANTVQQIPEAEKPSRQYCMYSTGTLGWSDLALFAIFEIGHIAYFINLIVPKINTFYVSADQNTTIT